MNKSSKDHNPKLNRFAHGIIHRKVSQMIGHNGFREQDRESLIQELIARSLQSLQSFDPKKSHLNAFITTVVERGVANMIRDRRALKRDQRQVTSLNETGDGGEQLSAMIGQREYDARRCHTPRSDEDASQLASDMNEVISRLPPDLRMLAEQLKEKSLSQISRELGVPRSTLRIRLQKLREKFEAAEIRNYL